MNVLLWIFWSVGGGTVVGWLANRVIAFYMDNPLTFNANFSLEPLIEGIVERPLWLDSRTMWAFWVGLAILIFSGMATYDYGGEKRHAKEVRNKEYGGSRWATYQEMEKFEHITTKKVVSISVPKQPRARRRFMLRHPKDFIMASLGITKKKKNPKPEWCDKLEDDNIILSEAGRLQLSKIPDPKVERNKHVYIIGGSGAGKTFNYVGPNIMQLYGSYVLTDPKGDTLKQYGNFFLKHGYDLKVVTLKDSQDLKMSMHYNPLLYLTDSTSILQIVNLLVENTSGDSSQKHSGEDFFVKAEKQLYMALIGYLFFFYQGQPQYQTFNEMVNLLQLTKGEDPNQKLSPLDVIIMGYDGGENGESFMGYKQWLIEKYGSEAAAQRSDEWFVITQYQGFKSTAGSPETEASVIASCNVRMAPFTVGAVKDFFSEDELELDLLGERKTAFFLVMSDMDTTFNFILSMMLYQLFERNTKIADRNKGSHCKIPVVCILDEVANIGKIPDLETKIATLRSRWIYLHPILQNKVQLKDVYGAEAAKTIEGNCDTTLYLGRSDFDSNKEFSEQLGKYTEIVRNRSESHGQHGSYSDSESRIAKDLLSASDMTYNPDEFDGDECIVMIKNARPFKDMKFMTPDHPRYHELDECGEFVLEDWRYDQKQAAEAELRDLARKEIELNDQLNEFMSGMDVVWTYQVA